MDLFVYGTLRDPDLIAAVAGPSMLIKSMDAVLPDCRVRPIEGDVYPMLAFGHGAAKGVLWSRLSEEQMERIKLYESAYGYTLKQVEVIAGGNKRMTQAFMPPATLVPGPDDWFLHDWQRKYQPAALYAAQEIFAYDPLPSVDSLRKMWHTVEMRAWAQVRARQEKPVQTRRRKPAHDCLGVMSRGALRGEFFRLQAFDVEHRRFDGEYTGTLRREVFLGVDAVLVLPYDAKRDKVLLVEQARMGPVMRGDRNPWCLEPVAGMVASREEPDEAALREAREEAGLDTVELRKINTFYPSPGTSTDYFHSYVGLCDLPMTDIFVGGQPHARQDLRLHPMSLSEALTLAETGEISGGPLIMMLYWLALHRQQMAAAA